MSKAKSGTVVSTKMAKTAVVIVESVHPHPLYKKTVRRTKKYHVHDPFGVKVGDVVEFGQSRPLSATKHWIITKVLTAGEMPEPEKVATTKSKLKPKPKSSKL